MTWDVLSDEEPPIDLLTVLQKAQYNPQLIRTFAERNRNRNLLVNELAKLLEPSSELVSLAVANIEIRRMTDAVVDGWKPVLAGAIEEWAKQRTLHIILNPPKQRETPTTDRVVTTLARIFHEKMFNNILHCIYIFVISRLTETHLF